MNSKICYCLNAEFLKQVKDSDQDLEGNIRMQMMTGLFSFPDLLATCTLSSYFMSAASEVLCQKFK
jgi:predicted transcriptional regulator